VNFQGTLHIQKASYLLESHQFKEKRKEEKEKKKEKKEKETITNSTGQSRRALLHICITT